MVCYVLEGLDLGLDDILEPRRAAVGQALPEVLEFLMPRAATLNECGQLGPAGQLVGKGGGREAHVEDVLVRFGSLLDCAADPLFQQRV